MLDGGLDKIGAGKGSEALSRAEAAEKANRLQKDIDDAGKPAENDRGVALLVRERNALEAKYGLARGIDGKFH